MVKELLNDAVNKVRSNHCDLAINLKYVELHDLPPAVTKDQMLRAIANGTNIDIISLDQIWLGEFAEKGFLTDLTNYTEKWGKISEWYQSNLDGGVYNDKIYGIWYETDVRGIWYWKDLLNQSKVDPDNKTSTSTLMGGWQFNIPVSSFHKDIAWEIIENMLKPEVLSP